MNLITPFLIGLFSSVHCLAMCGGLCALFCRSKPTKRTILLINFGRISSYSLLGLVFAGLIQGFALRIPVAEIGFWLRSLLGLVLIFLGIKVLFNKSKLPNYFSSHFLWQRAKTKLQQINQKNTLISHFSKGLLWGMIPCGLLYGVLIAAATTGNYIQGALFMFAFGLGTLPSMFIAAGVVQWGQDKLQAKSIRYGVGLFIIVIGLWSLISPWFSHELLPNHPVYTSIIAFLDSCVP